MWHGYFGIENINLSDAQRDTLVAVLRQLGPASDPSPARIMHWRTRLDGQAAIFEAMFQNGDLTVATFKQRLANIFGIDPATISHSTVTQDWGNQETPVITFSRNGTDYLRVAVFAGKQKYWEASGDAARGYISANLAEWELPEP